MAAKHCVTVGRPRKAPLPIEAQVEQLARYGLDWKAIAEITGLSMATLSRRGYAKLIQKGHAQQKADILAAAMRLVADGNPQVVVHMLRAVVGAIGICARAVLGVSTWPYQRL